MSSMRYSWGLWRSYRGGGEFGGRMGLWGCEMRRGWVWRGLCGGFMIREGEYGCSTGEISSLSVRIGSREERGADNRRLSTTRALKCRRYGTEPRILPFSITLKSMPRPGLKAFVMVNLKASKLKRSFAKEPAHQEETLLFSCWLYCTQRKYDTPIFILREGNGSIQIIQIVSHPDDNAERGGE
ncbi:hypothetical protein Salat_2529300 [Sesamum alatum]|uniref:Uncharacterized protein n=1 Tax=Sesamum alatum TaxID=300844 RepID=A0AAE1XS22_9LAMI|nr:hypothetical protein Salat_2529300 [Sesamum alatum]